MNKAAEVAALLAGDQKEFESVLSSIPKNSGALLVEALQRLDASDLTNTECERRFEVLLTRTDPSEEEQATLGEAVAKLNRGVLRNAAIQALPAHLRANIYKKKPPDGIASAKVATPRDKSMDAKSTTRQSIEAVPIPTDDDRVTPRDAPQVIILSRDTDVATANRLSEADFVRQRYETIAEINQVLDAGDVQNICAFLVEASFMEGLTADEQLTLLERLASYSSFAFIRIQEDGVKTQKAAVMSVIRRARCLTHEPGTMEVSFREQAGVRAAEIEELKAASSEIAAPITGLFAPGELSEVELLLLAAGLARHIRARGLRRDAPLKIIRTRTLHGGFTGAKVLLVRLNDDTHPVVVKIAERAFIAEESKRFMTFIAADDRELRPDIYFHGPVGLIVFDVISRHDDDRNPAPTLEKRLQELWYCEAAGDDPAPLANELGVAFESAIAKFVRLNKRHCAAHDTACKANPYLNSIEKMERAGFVWGFGEDHLRVRRKAMDTLEAAGGWATCHGDSHGRNVLVRRDQAYLIDYEFSGPGHPASDLARLELSVFLSHFRPLGAEAEVVALQRDMSVWENHIDTILLKHSGVIGSKSNELFVRLCIKARDAAKYVLASYGLGYEHYRDIKLLFCWQQLLGAQAQHGLVRATILALI
jgi:hypothetical protein